MTPERGPGRRRLGAALATPVDAASLAVFRIGYGSIIAWEIWRAFDGNLIRADYDLPRYMFRWWFFRWVHPLPGTWIYIAFAVLGFAALFLAFGLFSRAAAAITALGIAYWFLMEKAAYLNHRYLAGLLAFLLIFMPASAIWSLDARRRSGRSGTIPAWCLWLLRFQIGVPYFFGGVAKLNYDWVFRAEPLRSTLAFHQDFPLIGGLFDNSVLAHVLAIGSLGLDLSVPFLMLHRRTRLLAFGFALAFHLINSRIFEIGIFPWLMIVGTTLFFEPDWPKRMLEAMREKGRTRTVTTVGLVTGALLGALLPDSISFVRTVVGSFGVGVLAFHIAEGTQVRSSTPTSGKLSRRVAVALGAWTVVQISLPLTHFFIPGNVYWTEERNRFAWHMLVRAKKEDIRFRLTDGKRMWIEDPRRHLTRYQASKLEVPDLVLEFAHHLDDYYRARGVDDLEVRVDSFVALNGRPPQRAIDPRVDLTRISRPYIPPAHWIRPLLPFGSEPDRSAD